MAKKHTRNRISEIVTMKGRDLVPCAQNWRKHNNGQRTAMAAAIGKVGVAEILKGYRREDGSVELIDGHMRAEDYPDHDWQVAILDVTPEEAAFILATMDPLAAMARTDESALQDLLGQLLVEDDDLAAMLESLISAEPDFTPHPESGPHQIPSFGGGGMARAGQDGPGGAESTQANQYASEEQECLHGGSQNHGRFDDAASVDVMTGIPHSDSAKQMNTGILKFGIIDLPISAEGVAAFKAALDEWVGLYGVRFGFVEALLRSEV